jgi:hypothetical protein
VSLARPPASNQPASNQPASNQPASNQATSYQVGTQTIAFPKYTRYVDDAADMARIIRGEKPSDFSYEHDLTVQKTLLQACDLPLG